MLGRHRGVIKPGSRLNGAVDPRVLKCAARCSADREVGANNHTVQLDLDVHAPKSNGAQKGSCSRTSGGALEFLDVVVGTSDVVEVKGEVDGAHNTVRGPTDGAVVNGATALDLRDGGFHVVSLSVGEGEGAKQAKCVTLSSSSVALERACLGCLFTDALDFYKK